MSIMGRQTFDKERVHFNVARLRKGGIVFEVVIDPDLAIAYKNKQSVEIKDILKSEKVFNDATKGTIASETKMKELFGTSDALKVAEIILNEGEINLTEEYREKLREEKKRKIITIIAKNGIDPRTKLPHPPQRIENAMKEAKVRIDDFRKAEDQVEEIVRKIRPILPISFEKKKIMIKFPPQYSGKAYAALSGFAKPEKEEWGNDGSFTCIIEIPAGLEPDFYEKLNSITKGTAETKVL
ncbi:MAG: ribosome assembly factor SBDS [Candidatus Woesearchaeota archaeon]|nr:ribosome assembly factor SBDS [Candidatus Woesearchaeota archaeon]